MFSPPDVPPRFQVLAWLGFSPTTGAHSFRVRDLSRMDDGPLELVILKELDGIGEARRRFQAIVELGHCSGMRRVHEVLDETERLLFLTGEARGQAILEVDVHEYDPFDVAFPVAAALGALHDAGLVHGAVRADNLTVDAGWVVLGPPAVVPAYAEPEEDWIALGKLLERFGEAASTARLARGLATGTTGRNEATFELMAELVRRRRAIGHRSIEEFAQGGMGRIDLVWDTILDRELARKVLKDPSDSDRVARFVRESKLTASLQHPGVLPVHGRGTLPDGSPYFTMPLLREGQTLAAALAARADPEATNPMTLRSLVEALAAATEAVAFAHSRGIIHRDLKPEHIHLGEFGAVYVLDWGLAKVVGEPETLAASLPGEGNPKPSSAGHVLGTPEYAPPEQMSGQPALHCPASDVYSLGACLHEILTGSVPTRPTADADAGDADPRAREPIDDPDAPTFLVGLAEACLNPTIEDRPQDASVLLESLRDWLRGDERRAQALADIVGVEEILDQADEARRTARELRNKADDALSELPALAPVEDKAPAWALQEEAKALELEAETLDARYVHTLQGALETYAQLDRARELLHAFHRSRLENAERSGDERGIARHAQYLRAHGQQAWIDASGRLTLHTDPPGARVQLWRWPPLDRWLEPEPARDLERELGVTPLVGVEIPRGRWLLRILRPDSDEPVNYPIQIDRGSHWDAVPPGHRESFPVWLPPPGALSPDERYVPGGWFTAGEDDGELAVEPVRCARLWCDGFSMQVNPVTHGDYIEFLDDLVASGRRDEAEALQPRLQDDAALYRLTADGTFDFDTSHPLARSYCRRDAPVICVDWFGARAYARWSSERTGQSWDLPSELEWEKAARGVDGRIHPWGSRRDPTLTCLRTSHEDEPRPATIHDFPRDVSPYGIRHLAGNVREWCADEYSRYGLSRGPRVSRIDTMSAEAERRVVRGGSWGSRWSHAASRLADPPAFRATVFGFRLRRYIGPVAE